MYVELKKAFMPDFNMISQAENNITSLNERVLSKFDLGKFTIPVQAKYVSADKPVCDLCNGFLRKLIG
jgi:hypothetical protein